MKLKLPETIQLRLLKEDIFHRVLSVQHLASLKDKDQSYIQGYIQGQLYIVTCCVAQACKKNLRNGVSNLRTKTVKRFNYAKAAFYVYLLTMIMFVATNAAAKFAFINGVK